ncbi:ATP-binding cassette domain-containing protein [Leptospira langatensis]|uniref:ATP-binding cassette domain-containing protein n=1 Tax=Leptospira langatensis TaxID=2484983 RepID=A0A5F1ZRA5_9LEPT|nr:ATP-binding cassette domain-containing protein [Leptospira langatensis]TGK02595.1 ATP-binding cassette domain-containing protein [Leptospira langatensis]TGL40204.1 ATP-binding cassette domain-containing protein [Leptospira langatensis]
MNILVTKKLTKAFGDRKVVDSLDLVVEQGEIFALIGPNGAGKTTTIKMLTTLLEPSSGEAIIDGHDLATQTNEIRKIIGYVPQMLSVDGSLTGYENLMLFAKLYDIPRREREIRVRNALEFMGLSSFGDTLVQNYSGGMVRRLEIAQSTIHRPKILFLDEPTVGLDPIGRSVVWEHITALRKEFSTTIIMTTHLMDEVDKLCSKMALMSQGKLAAIGSPAELKKSAGGPKKTLEEVFIHYAKENNKGSDEDFSSVSRERKIAKRLG